MKPIENLSKTRWDRCEYTKGENFDIYPYWPVKWWYCTNTENKYGNDPNNGVSEPCSTEDWRHCPLKRGDE